MNPARQPDASDSHSSTRGLARDYGRALSEDNVSDLLALMAPEASLQSPFSLWDTPRQISAAIRARSTAFPDLSVDRIISDASGATILWHASLHDDRIDGCDVLITSDAAITRVDVFVRPAHLLSAVSTAMATAWPGRSDAQ
jgi:hypothetical protein